MSKYDHIKEPIIRKALEDYKDNIDEKKPDELSLSTYRVDKHWGYEIWLEMNEYFTLKLIHFKKGNKCSLQLHEYKIESIYVIEGEAEVFLEDKDGNWNSKVYGPGSGWSVPLNRRHRVLAKTDFTIIQAQSSHLDDIVRFEDDLNRTSGKIEDEHRKN